MTDQPYIVEMAVLLLIAFVLGGLAGFWARRWFMPRAVTGTPEKATEPANTPALPGEQVSLAAESASGIAEQIPAPVAAKPDAKTKSQAQAKTRSAKPTTSKPAKTARKPKPDVIPAVPEPDVSGDEEQGKPDLLAAARDGGPDDLKKIRGIGPKIENLLHGLGVYHFDQIAAWGAAEISWVDDKLSFRGRIDREGWVSQARTLVQPSS